MQKLFVTEDNKATLFCPVCAKSRSIDASAYIAIERVVRIRIKCPCGHHYPAQLERRRHFRKTVNFEGFYSQAPGGRVVAHASGAGRQQCRGADRSKCDDSYPFHGAATRRSGR